MIVALKTLNQPALVVSAGVAVVSLLPAFEQAYVSGRISWSVLKTASVFLSLLNKFAFHQQGRLGLEYADLIKTADPDVRPLIVPAEWGFADFWETALDMELLYSFRFLLASSQFSH